ncbi:hypothetical protein PGIGA_G00083690 [Pangasianodon gigas]|uniref:Uncharacterized protein n=1 Tax=Pangasianodon gigas TaxID=30993 RepID=A0ACC5XAM6_PANGG|nr:hypothetical protein [Pangasianodon gigas]
MLSGKFLCLLLALTFSSSRNTGAVDVTVSSGDTAFLPCPLLFKYSDSMRISVKWEKDEVKEPSLFSSLTLQLMNSTDSSCVELLCSLKGLRPQQVNFTWTRATQLLYHHESSNMSSTLMLCKPHWTDGETLTCHANYSHNHTLYSKSITLPCGSGSCNVGEGSWLTIVIISTCAGLLLLVLLGVAFFKCKERGAANGSIVYSNKIYENFTFSSATINTTSSSQNAQPGARSNIRSTTRSNQQIISQTQREECIYEN